MLMYTLHKEQNALLLLLECNSIMFHAKSEIPEATPSIPASRVASGKPLIEIPEEETWRLIQQTGILEAAKNKKQVEEGVSLGDEIFNAVLLIIPFSSLLLLIEM